MAKHRCALCRDKFDLSEFRHESGFLVHADSSGEPVHPPHEAVEGRLLRRVSGGWDLFDAGTIPGVDEEAPDLSDES